MSGPTGTTVERRGSGAEVGLRGRCCDAGAGYGFVARSAAPEDDDDDEEDIGRSPTRPLREMGEEGCAQGAGAHSG